jgi:hypothetical protein
VDEVQFTAVLGRHVDQRVFGCSDGGIGGFAGHGGLGEELRLEVLHC